MQYTVGDYVDRLMATAHSDTYHLTLMGQAIEEDPEVPCSWEDVKARTLDAEHVIALAEEMLFYAREEMQMEPEALYTERLREWHAFLRAMHRTAGDMGIELPIVAIDQPITPTDMMVDAMLVERTPGGKVNLTERGEAVATTFATESPEAARKVREALDQIDCEEK